MFSTPVSIGEIFDKLTILDIKRERIADPVRNAHVSREFSMLHDIVASEIDKCPRFYKMLKVINTEIWDSMNIVRDIKENTPVWAKECRKVLVDNDRRFRVKNKINTLIKSDIKEQKSYDATAYSIPFVFDRETITMAYPLIRYRSTEYDTIQVTCVSGAEHICEMFCDDPTISITFVSAAPSAVTTEELYADLPTSVMRDYAEDLS